MPPKGRGSTPTGFRDQLLQRLRNDALRDRVPVQRLQQRVAFERLLARLPRSGEWVLKGGLALLFRYGSRTRTTRDVDLSSPNEIVVALARFRASVATAAIDDGFSFEFGEVAQEMQGAPGGSRRIRVVAKLAGLAFTNFHVDLSSGDPIIEEPDILGGSDLLEFAGIARIEFPVYPITQHLAEKFHAYTLPRVGENTRVKDLIDLVLLASTERVEARRLSTSIAATFGARGTHDVPPTLPEPPSSWERPYSAAVSEMDPALAGSLRSGHEQAARFWDPYLSGSAAGQAWSPDQRRWE